MVTLDTVCKIGARHLQRLDDQILELRILAQLVRTRVILTLSLKVIPDFVSDARGVHAIVLLGKQRILGEVEVGQMLVVG